MKFIRYSNYFKSVLGTAAFLLLLAITPANVSAQDSFGDFVNQQKNEYENYLEGFEDGVAESEEAYENYREAYKKEFQEFKRDMKEKWGDFKSRSKKQWVEYKDDGNLRVSTNFETGKGKVEVIADTKEEAEKVKEEMPEKVEESVQSKGTREGFETEKIPNKDVTDEPVLKGQLKKPEDKSVKQYSKEIAEQKTKTKKVKGADGKSRYVVYVNFELADDYLKKRARKVEDDVYKFSKQNNLDPALVFAIIHTESYFNPTAASAANAYGLMQLVPTTGGRDAYRRIFNEDGIPTKQFLFKPANNINMGCTFVDILKSRYFKNVESKLTKEYMVISAYNTGQGNVSIAYTGDTRVSEAIRKANNMSDQENYDYLRKNLEYEEARNYLKKVNTQRLKYEKWKKRRQQ